MSNPYLSQIKKLKLGKSNTGFTLIEILVAAIIIGVISAIAAPNLIGLMNFTRVKQGIAQVEGGIKEGQRQATRLGKRCIVTINTADNEITAQTVEATPVNCLLSNRELNDSLEIATNVVDNGTTNNFDITFSSKGSTNYTLADTAKSGAMFIVYMTNGTEEQRCFVIADGLGLSRIGNYDGDPTAAPEDLEPDDCITISSD